MDRQVWDDVRRILLDPARVASPAGRTRRHLLSGIAICGVCRAPVRATTIRTPGRDRVRRVYTCKARGCVVAEEAEVDAIVVAAVLARLARPDAATLVDSRQTPDGRAVRRLAGLRRRQEEAATEYANGGITIGQLRTITRELEPQIEALEHRLAPPVPVISVLPDLIAGDTERVWATLDLRQQRAVISSLATVRILRAARPGPHSFNPKRVRVTCC